MFAQKVMLKMQKLGAYYGTRKRKVRVYSNYYLLGSREKFIILKLFSLYETIKRAQIFVRLASAARSEIWCMCLNGGNLRLARWLADTFKGHFINWTYQLYVFFRWRRRYFAIGEKFFRFKLGRYIGMDLLFLFSRSRSVYIPAFAAKAPVIMFGHPEDSLYSGYKLVCSAESALMYVFYARLLALSSSIGRNDTIV